MWIVGFEDRYEITKEGKVFFHKNGKRTERKLVADKDGYMTINLKIKSKVFCKKIHREVAKTYIYPYDGEHINHINGIKNDNRVENLEWCSSQDNINHMWIKGLKKLGCKYKSNTTGYYGITYSNNKFNARIRRNGREIYLGTYDNVEEACFIIESTLKDEAMNLPLKSFKKDIEILQYDLNNNLIATYSSISEAEKITLIANQSIGKNILGKLKSAGGFIWKRNQKIDFI